MGKLSYLSSFLSDFPWSTFSGGSDTGSRSSVSWKSLICLMKSVTPPNEQMSNVFQGGLVKCNCAVGGGSVMVWFCHSWEGEFPSNFLPRQIGIKVKILITNTLPCVLPCDRVGVGWGGIMRVPVSRHPQCCQTWRDAFLLLQEAEEKTWEFDVAGWGGGVMKY